jgi:hypothetical protein
MILPPKLILFNGPRHCGKDTAANHCKLSHGAHLFKMSRPLKAGIETMFDLTPGDVEYLESIKTQPSSILFGKSYVDVQISLGEDWFKEQFGEDIFGRIARKRIEKQIRCDPHQRLYVCSDSGFTAEAGALLDLFGFENVLLVRISRTGKTFAGDSRSYIDLPVTTVNITNDVGEESYCHSVEQLVDWFLFGQEHEFMLPSSASLVQTRLLCGIAELAN